MSRAALFCRSLLILDSKGQGSGLLLGSLPANQKLCRNAADVTEYNSMRKIHPHLHNALSNENMKWYFRDTSYNNSCTDLHFHYVGVNLHSPQSALSFWLEFNYSWLIHH